MLPAEVGLRGARLRCQQSRTKAIWQGSVDGAWACAIGQGMSSAFELTTTVHSRAKWANMVNEARRKWLLCNGFKAS
jgi:hypothetical protein